MPLGEFRDLLLRAGVTFSIGFLSLFLLYSVEIANLELPFTIGSVSQRRYPFQGHSNEKLDK